jgi:hypothetical protein
MVIKLYEHNIKNEKGAEQQKLNEREKAATEDAKETFKKMANQQDTLSGVMNVFVLKKDLLVYLKARYTVRLATKMNALFDWT